MADHTFIAQRVAFDAYDSIIARCSCGWVSAYSHAFEKYAEGDHDFHVETVALACAMRQVAEVVE